MTKFSPAAVDAAPVPAQAVGMNATPVVEVTDLRKRYRSHDPLAVDGVSLALQPGQAFGLLGPNGAGKSTVVKSILGLTHPTSGEVRLFGSAPGDARARANVGFAPEDPDFPKFLRADEVLDYFGRLLGLNADERRVRSDEALAWAGLAGERRQIRGFSKGMKQRLALAQAILGRPKLLIFDEPTSDLDPVGRRDVRDTISQLKTGGTTILLNSHLLSEVERVCDRVAILVRGKVLAEGTIHQLVPEGKSLEQVFIELVEATTIAPALPAFMKETN
jgi:ABC-2 type transport system ATP-binding protein